MATAAIKIKIMPEGLDIDLNKIKEEATKKITAEGGVLSSYVEEPIAFGLKALIATLAWPEAKSTDLVEQIFSELPGVSSVSIIDYRRALG
ncbi:MAG: elongation factor 1-beta [Nanoarchaeota archaeon]|nr:elongation factor 1-beta [Nanoarchaeota archaeon]